MRIVVDMSGRIADADADLAAGYYLYQDPEDAQIEYGCGDLRPGFVDLGNGTRIPTCGGNLETHYLPDMVLQDDFFKAFISPFAIGAIVLLIIAIYRTL